MNQSAVEDESAVGQDEPAGHGSAPEAEEPAFGAEEPTRFAADVEYRGSAGPHDYVVRVRHRFLDTSFTVVIDGVEHDPKAEEKARKEKEKEKEKEGDEAGGAEESAPTEAADGLRFRLEEGFTTLRCTVRRPRTDDEHTDCEVLSLHTAGLGGAGEVDVRHGFDRTLLVPAEGSPSAARDAKRTEHPTRYALIAAVTKGAKYLLPLLGFGALFSGLLDPLKEWVAARIRPAIEAISRLIDPLMEWIEAVTRPVREFLDMLLSPVRELLAAILRPVRDFLRWLVGLLPDVELPFSIPEWVVDIAVPLLVVAMVFAATFAELRRRREKLAATRARAASSTAGPGSAGPAAASGEASPDHAGSSPDDEDGPAGPGEGEAADGAAEDGGERDHDADPTGWEPEEERDPVEDEAS